MSAQKITFIHASDFQLGRPVLYFSDAAECCRSPIFIPADIRTEPQDSFYEHYIAASFHSAKNVFDAAIKQRVNFVLITGDVFYHGEADPYAIRFLDRQLRRLEEQGIWVCWAIENDDASADSPFPALLQAWWECHSMPENIAILKGDKSCKKSFRLADNATGSQATTILDSGVSSLEPDVSLIYVPGGEVSDGVSNLRESACNILIARLPVLERLSAEHEFAYGCVLGENRRRTYGAKFDAPNAGEYFFHSPGATQGYSPAVFTQNQRSEQPVFGCSLIEMDRESPLPLAARFIETETIAWRLLCVNLPPEVADLDGVAGLLQRESEIVHGNSPSTAACTLVVWFLHSDSPSHVDLLRKIYLENRSLGKENSSEIVLTSLRQASGAASPFLCHLPVLASAEPAFTEDDQLPSDAVCDFQHLVRVHANRLSETPEQLDFDGANSPFYMFARHSLDLSDYLANSQKTDILNLLAATQPAEMMLNLLRDADLLGTASLLKRENSMSYAAPASSSDMAGEEAKP